MRTRFPPLTAGCVLTVLVFLSHRQATAAAAADPAEEARMAAEEEAAEERLPLHQKPPDRFTGKLALFPEGSRPHGPEVLGTFACQDGRSFLVKLAFASLLSELKKHDQGTVTLFGKIRVKGKYFIVQAVDEPSPGPPRQPRTRPGGA
jgi:hypothetical protein